MPSLRKQIIELLNKTPGLTDREITNTLRGSESLQQSINQTCRNLKERGEIERRIESDGLIRNYNTDSAIISLKTSKKRSSPHTTHNIKNTANIEITPYTLLIIPSDP